MRLALLVTLAILAFAGNSLLTRAGLAAGLIGAGAFVAVRLVSGALLLGGLATLRGSKAWPDARDARGIAALTVYMLGFTFAYRQLGAATGALILFASVQLTMVGVSVARGTRPTPMESAGALLALAGLLWLLLDDLRSPQWLPAWSMVSAGVAWGFYTLVGRGAVDPLAMTARNFIGAAPIGIAAWAWAPSEPVAPLGLLYAVLSGALTSGLGYAIWYAAVPRLSRITAGVAQLLVPPVTATGAALMLAEPIGLRLIVATALIVAGVAMTIVKRTG
jgi:drug/metabolite transporter (DMT)-like permease